MLYALAVYDSWSSDACNRLGRRHARAELWGQQCMRDCSWSSTARPMSLVAMRIGIRYTRSNGAMPAIDRVDQRHHAVDPPSSHSGATLRRTNLVIAGMLMQLYRTAPKSLDVTKLSTRYVLQRVYTHRSDLTSFGRSTSAAATKLTCPHIHRHHYTFTYHIPRYQLC